MSQIQRLAPPFWKILDPPLHYDAYHSLALTVCALVATTRCWHQIWIKTVKQPNYYLAIQLTLPTVFYWLFCCWIATWPFRLKLKHKRNLKHTSGRSKGGHPWRAPPYYPKFSQFHAVFRKIWQNHMLVLPLEGWSPSYGESWFRHCWGKHNARMDLLIESLRLCFVKFNLVFCDLLVALHALVEGE